MAERRHELRRLTYRRSWINRRKTG